MWWTSKCPVLILFVCFGVGSSLRCFNFNFNFNFVILKYRRTTYALLICLLCYFSVEFICFCVFVQEYILSWFFWLDVLCLFAVATEFTSFYVMMNPTAFWGFLNILTFHHLPLVRSGRGARYVARIGRFSTLRFSKVA
jgi:hypothetical protein